MTPVETPKLEGTKSERSTVTEKSHDFSATEAVSPPVDEGYANLFSKRCLLLRYNHMVIPPWCR